MSAVQFGEWEARPGKVGLLLLPLRALRRRGWLCRLKPAAREIAERKASEADTGEKKTYKKGGGGNASRICRPQQGYDLNKTVSTRGEGGFRFSPDLNERAHSISRSGKLAFLMRGKREMDWPPTHISMEKGRGAAERTELQPACTPAARNSVSSNEEGIHPAATRLQAEDAGGRCWWPMLEPDAGG